MSFLKYSFLLMLLAVGLPLLAQDDLESEEVEVIRNFDARLLDTEKIEVPPSLPPLDTATQRQTYAVPTRDMNIEYPPPRIRPLSIRGNRLPTVYKGYLKAGGGLPNALYGEAAYNTFANKNFNVGLELNHHSSDNSKELQNQRFSFTNAQATGTYYAKEGFAVKGKVGFTADNVHFYGFNALADSMLIDTSVVDFEDRKQNFTILDVGATVFNGTRTAADFNYSAGFDFYSMGDITPANEQGFNLNLMGEKWFQGTHPLKVVLKTDFTRYSPTEDSTQNLNNFYLQPNFTYHGQNFRIDAGANVVSHEDKFSFFPDLELSANVLGSMLGIFVGAEGDLTKNTFRTLAAYNPYINSQIGIGNTTYTNYYGGAKGSVQGINYRAEAGYKSTENLAVFNWNRVDIDRFDVNYLDFDIFYFKAEASASIDEFKINAGLTQNVFNEVNEGDKAWHLPSFTTNVSVQYTALEGQLQVKGEVFIENGVSFLNDDFEEEKLNGLFDISLGADYFFSEKFGAFINLYNVASNKRERWYRYPTLGLNALAGISMKF